MFLVPCHVLNFIIEFKRKRFHILDQ